jgi:hypothetical protein
MFSLLNAETKLTAADIVARSRKALGMETEDDEMPKIFDDDIYHCIQQSLLLLEKRVQDGPGSLSKEEVDTLVDMTQRISREMKEFDTRPPSNVASPPRNYGAQSSVTDTFHPTTAGSVDRKRIPLAPPLPQQPDTKTERKTGRERSTVGVDEGRTREDSDLSEEGGDYDGTGGFGLAKGTRNTYIIPGMEEMSPEEYRAELQRSVLERQRERWRSRGGLVGNRAAHDYLNTLGYGGTSKSLSVGRDEPNAVDGNM